MAMHLKISSILFLFCLDPSSSRRTALLLTWDRVIVNVIQGGHNVFGVQRIQQYTPQWHDPSIIYLYISLQISTLQQLTKLIICHSMPWSVSAGSVSVCLCQFPLHPFLLLSLLLLSELLGREAKADHKDRGDIMIYEKSLRTGTPTSFTPTRNTCDYVCFSARVWAASTHFCEVFASKLKFPTYFGKIFAAMWNHCLWIQLGFLLFHTNHHTKITLYYFSYLELESQHYSKLQLHATDPL